MDHRTAGVAGRVFRQLGPVLARRRSALRAREAFTALSFRQIRIGLLSLALVGVVLYAWSDVRSRRRRNEWQNTLVVAVVLLEEAPVDPAAIDLLRAHTAPLSAQLASEQHRYLETDVAPFAFEVFGPAHVSVVPPALTGSGLWDLLQYTWNLRRYVHVVDEAMGVDSSRFDSCIYTTVRPPVADTPSHVEGQSEHGGRLGQVRVELGPDMVDVTLHVVTHELLHTLGATDKYDARGYSTALADPDQVSLYPQTRVEIMARNRPVAPGSEVVPVTIAELGVGPLTAKEIGWQK